MLNRLQLLILSIGKVNGMNNKIYNKDKLKKSKLDFSKLFLTMIFFGNFAQAMLLNEGISESITSVELVDNAFGAVFESQRIGSEISSSSSSKTETNLTANDFVENFQSFEGFLSVHVNRNMLHVSYQALSGDHDHLLQIVSAKPRTIENTRDSLESEALIENENANPIFKEPQLGDAIEKIAEVTLIAVGSSPADTTASSSNVQTASSSNVQ